MTSSQSSIAEFRALPEKMRGLWDGLAAVHAAADRHNPDLLNLQPVVAELGVVQQWIYCILPQGEIIPVHREVVRSCSAAPHHTADAGAAGKGYEPGSCIESRSGGLVQDWQSIASKLPEVVRSERRTRKRRRRRRTRSCLQSAFLRRKVRCTRCGSRQWPGWRARRRNSRRLRMRSFSSRREVSRRAESGHCSRGSMHASVTACCLRVNSLRSVLAPRHMCRALYVTALSVRGAPSATAESVHDISDH